MKNILTIVLLLQLLSNDTSGQIKLYLQKGREKIKIRDHATIGLVTAHDSIPYGDYVKIDSIGLNSLVMKNYKRYEYEYATVGDDSFNIKYQEGWRKYYSFSNKGGDSSGKWKYPIRKVLSSGPPVITYAYSDIKQIQYANSEKDPPDGLAFIFIPFVVIAAPIASWDHGKFLPGTFFSLLGIGAGGSALLYFDIQSRKIKTYRMSEWQIRAIDKNK